MVTSRDAAEQQLPDWLNVFTRIPGARALIAADNYSGVREMQRDRADKERIEGKASQMRGPSTKRAVHRLFQLREKKEEKRSSAEQREYENLSAWYHAEYQGTPDAPGNFATLKAKAAGDKNVDADYAKERLETTAKEALEAAQR